MLYLCQIPTGDDVRDFVGYESGASEVCVCGGGTGGAGAGVLVEILHRA